MNNRPNKLNIIQHHHSIAEKVKVDAVNSKYISDLQNSRAIIIKSKQPNCPGQDIKNNIHSKQTFHGGIGRCVPERASEKVHTPSSFGRSKPQSLALSPSNPRNYIDAKMAFICAKKGANKGPIKSMRDALKWKPQIKASSNVVSRTKAPTSATNDKTSKMIPTKNVEPLKILNLKGLPPLQPWKPGKIPEYKLSGCLRDMEDMLQKALLESANDSLFDQSRKGQELKEQSFIFIQKKLSPLASIGRYKEEECKIKKIPRRPWTNWNFKSQWPMPL